MSESENKKERKERKEERRPSCDMYWQYSYVADIAVHVTDIAVLGPTRFHPLQKDTMREETICAMTCDNDISCCVVVP